MTKARIRWEFDIDDPDGIIRYIDVAAQETFSRFDLKSPLIDLLLADDATLRKLNSQWRGIDKPTDVLSFAAREEENFGANTKSKSRATVEFLGDIAISCETALRQAEIYGHSIEREISFLFVHGLLHLLGYDHIDPKDEIEMLEIQDEIFSSLEKKHPMLKRYSIIK